MNRIGVVSMLILLNILCRNVYAQTNVVTGPSGAFVTNVFIGTLNRPPDPVGWLYWASALDAGYYTKDSLANAFLGSPEYMTSTGNCPAAQPYNGSNDFFLRCVYWDTLGRNPDSGG